MGMKWQPLIGWIKKKRSTSEPTTWDGSEKYTHPCVHACIVHTPKQTQCKWGSLTIYAWLGESRTVSAVRWEAGIVCVDTDMVYCQSRANTRASLTGRSLFKSVNKAFGRGVVLTWKLSRLLKREQALIRIRCVRAFLNAGLCWRRPFLNPAEPSRGAFHQKYVELTISPQHALCGFFFSFFFFLVPLSFFNFLKRHKSSILLGHI